MILIWPFLVSIGKLLIPNLIRTAVPILANTAIRAIAGPPQSPQQAATYDTDYDEEYEDEEYEEYEDDEEYEE